MDVRIHADVFFALNSSHLKGCSYARPVKPFLDTYCRSGCHDPQRLLQGKKLLASAPGSRRELLPLMSPVCPSA